MVTRNINKQMTALARARERRRVLDRVRDEQDARIEEATASVLVVLEARAEMMRVVETATSHVGDMVKVLLGEDVSAERAAALLELDVVEVRRLVRAASVGGSGSEVQVESSSSPTVPDA
jgi:hypothetical protein